MLTNQGIGTISWLERTGGKLAWWDRLHMVYQGVQAQSAARRRSLHQQHIQMREFSELMPPDSAVTREAFALCQEISPPFLLNHCLRSYFWARLLDNDCRPFDDEAMFTACLLHDAGLCDHPSVPAYDAACFTLAGAKAAQVIALRHGWSDRRAELAAQAITLHLNIHLDNSHGKEAQMLRNGSGADVAGLGLHALDPEQIHELVKRFPRLDMSRQMAALLKQHTQHGHCCRTGYLLQRFSFEERIRKNRYFSE